LRLRETEEARLIRLAKRRERYSGGGVTRKREETRSDRSARKKLSRSNEDEYARLKRLELQKERSRVNRQKRSGVLVAAAPLSALRTGDV
jgi:hypothetical protein